MLQSIDDICTATVVTTAARRSTSCFKHHSRPLPFGSEPAKTCRTCRNRTDGLMSPRTNCISTTCWRSIHLSPLNHSSSSLALPLIFSISDLRYSSCVWFCYEFPVIYVQGLKVLDWKQKSVTNTSTPDPRQLFWAICGCVTQRRGLSPQITPAPCVFFSIVASWEVNAIGHPVVLPLNVCEELQRVIDKSNSTLPASMRRMRSYEVRTVHSKA